MSKFITAGLLTAMMLSFASSAGAQCQTNFNSTLSVNVNGFPDSMAAGDFNLDGRADLAVVSKNLSSVAILINQGNRFTLTVSYDVGSSPSSIAAGDFDNNGKIDLFVTNQNSNTFSILYGNGAGGFTSFGSINTLPQPSAIALADFNRDGGLDIAIMHLGSQFITVISGDGAGGFLGSQAISHSQFKGGTKVAFSDINLDGKPDIIALGKLFSGGFDYETIIVALANATGGFGTFSFLGVTGWSGTVADFGVTDVNSDAKPDIISTITTSINGVKYTVHRGSGTGTFPQGATTFDADAFPTGNATSLAVADFNADGKVDLALSNGTPSTTANLYTLPGTGNGPTPPAAPFIAGGGAAQKILAADFNGDGKPDIASTDPNQNKVNITFNTCGGFTTRPKGDFDGDGKTDLAIFRPSVGEWWYLKSGTTGGSGSLQFGNSSDRPVPADFTGDGKTDIAFWRPSTGNWFILRSEDFSFYAFPFGANGDIPMTGDYDGDGKADTAIFRPSTSIWYISKSSGGTSIQQFGQSGDVPVAGN